MTDICAEQSKPEQPLVTLLTVEYELDLPLAAVQNCFARENEFLSAVAVIQISLECLFWYLMLLEAFLFVCSVLTELISVLKKSHYLHCTDSCVSPPTSHSLLYEG